MSRLRALKVAMLYKEKRSQDETVSLSEETDGLLSDDVLKSTIKESLERAYPNKINSYLKGLPLHELLVAAENIVKTFHDSDTPTKLLDRELGSMKNKLLNSVGDVAYSESKSLKDTIYSHFKDKKNATDNIEVVSAYVVEKLLEIRRITDKITEKDLKT